MDLSRYTNKAQQAIVNAQSLANEVGSATIEPVHLLIALLTQEDGVAPDIMAKIGARPDNVLDDAQTKLNAMPRVSGSSTQAQLNRQTAGLFTQAERIARRMKDDYVSTEHILLALAENSSVSDMLARHGITPDCSWFGG